MVNRPYKCPLCHSVFRSESGMKWHLTHRHEVPAALDALRKDYENKNTSLKDENSHMKQELTQFQEELSLTKVALSEEKTAKLEAFKHKQQLQQELNKAIVELVLRDKILKDKFNIELPNPFAP